MVSTRIFASLLIVLSLLGVYYGWGIVTQFSYEPLGPRPFPIGTLVLIALCAILLFFFAENTNVQWPSFKVFQRLIALIISLFIFAFLFEYLGFIPCSILLIFAMALIFRATLIKALIFAILSGLFLYYFFDTLLQITLPLGYIFD